GRRAAAAGRPRRTRPPARDRNRRRRGGRPAASARSSTRTVPTGRTPGRSARRAPGRRAAARPTRRRGTRGSPVDQRPTGSDPGRPGRSRLPRDQPRPSSLLHSSANARSDRRNPQLNAGRTAGHTAVPPRGSRNRSHQTKSAAALPTRTMSKPPSPDTSCPVCRTRTERGGWNSVISMVSTNPTPPSPVNASSWVPSPPPPLSTRTSVPSIHSRCRGQSVATAHTVSGAAATGTLSRNSTDGTLFLRVVLRALVPGLVQRLSRSLQLPLQDRNPAAQLVQLTGDPVERPVHLGGLVAAEHLLELQR